MNYPQEALNLLEQALALVFPVRCIECHRFVDTNKKDYVCSGCLGALPPNINFRCIGCYKNTPLGKTCLECSKTSHVDRFLVVLDYKKPLAVKMLKTFKYRFIQDMIFPISAVVKKYLFRIASKNSLNLIAGNPLIIPVPLHPHRFRWRGFNQAELIAGSVSEILNLEIRPDVLVRVHDTKPQADITERDARLKNIRSIFKVTKPSAVKERNIILVDDICTTGATLNECAGVLKESGAQKITALAIARG